MYVFAPGGSELGRSTASIRQEQVLKAASQTGVYRVEVRDYAGSGEYVVDVSAGISQAPPQAQPPTVAFAQPEGGAVLSGAVAVKVRAADDQGVARVELAVDGGAWADITAGFDGGAYNYNWDSTGATDGAHTLTARATDTAGQQATASVSVTVANQGPPLAHELTRTGRVTSGSRDATFAITVHEGGFLDLSLAWATRADLDLYVTGPDGAQIGRAYTLNNPERLRVDTVRYGTGTYQVRVNLYSGPDSDFTLTADGLKQEVYQGTVGPGVKNVTHERTVAYIGRGRAALSWPGGSDLDFYVSDPAGRERGRAYTLNNPEQLDTAFDTTGAWTIRVNLYAGSGVSYTLKWIVPEATLS